MAADAAALEFGRMYGPVLGRMVEICGSEERVSFGEALERASRDTGITVPHDVRPVLLTTAFQIAATGRIPGLPDA